MRLLLLVLAVAGTPLRAAFAVPPVAEANGPYTVNQGVALAMNSAGSSDSDGAIVLFEWDCTDNGVYDVSNATGAGLLCTYPDDGSYTARLRVTDSSGSSATDTAVVTSTNTLPVAEAGGPYAGANNQPITVSAAGSSDADGTLMMYEWDCTADGTYELSSASPTGLLCNYPLPGTYTVRLRVTDDDGGTATDTTTAVATNPPPVAEANGPYTSNEGALLFMTAASSTDSNGLITLYEWDCDGNGTYDGSSTTPGGVSCFYADDGSHTLTLRVTDNNGSTATDTAALTVLNMVPIFTSYSGPVTGAEGAPVTFSTSASDPGALDVLTITWTFGDGTGTFPGGSVTHAFPDEGNFTVTRVVSDGDGGSTTATSSLSIGNAPPTIETLSVPDGSEGVPATFTATASDPGVLDTLNYAWSFGDGGGATGATASHAFADQGAYSVALMVTDGDGGTTAASATSNIANVDPAIVSLSGPTSGVEGQSLSFSVIATDVPADPLSYGWDWDDGTTPSGGASASHAWMDEGVYVVTLTVADDDGGSSTDTLTVAIGNGPPIITSFTAPDGLEGQPIAFSATASDPNPTDTIVFSWDFGDGATSPDATPSHTYPADGAYTVTLTVTDDDGATATATGSVTVGNVAPIWLGDVLPTMPLDEGELATFEALASDDGTDDVLTYAWDWDDGSAPGAGTPIDHAFPDQGVYTVDVVVTDSDGATVTGSFDVDVVNVPPVLTTAPPLAALEADAYVYAPSAADPGGAADPLVFALTGSPPSGMTISPTSGYISWTPTFAQALAGSVSVGLTVSDGDGGVDSQSWTIAVYVGDEDGDGMPDTWEIDNNLDPADPSDAAEDPDGDGLTNLEEFQGGTDPWVYDGPSVPVLISPVGGADAPASPELVLENSVDPQGDDLQYVFEVYGDEALTELVEASDPVPAGMFGTTSYQVDATLDEDTLYWWRARAFDAEAASDWADPAVFWVDAVNVAPPVPVLVYPVDETAPRQPTLLLGPVEDPDRDEVVYDIEVWNPEMTDLAASTSGLTSSGVDVAWLVDVALDEDADYVWTARARDDRDLPSEWAEPAPFRAGDTDNAPVGVMLIAPLDGSTLDTRSPELRAALGVDPEGTALTYTFDVDTRASFDSPDAHSLTLPGEGDPVIWSLADDGIVLPEGAWMFARVSATDEGGVASAPDTITFVVPGGDEPPPPDPEGCNCADDDAAASWLPLVALPACRRRRRSGK